MSQEQKIAWLAIGVFLVAAILFTVLWFTIGEGAWAAFGLFGIVGLGPLLFRKKRKDEAVAIDERDKAIGQKATMIGAIISYEVFIFACMATWFIYFSRGQELISVHTLPLIALAGGITFYVSRSIVLLVL